MINFKIKNTSNKARSGTLFLNNNIIETPCFMPVGTAATVKTMTGLEVSEMGYKIILANTFHLMLRPGVDIISDHGGIHDFMGWNGSIITEVESFQVAYTMGGLSLKLAESEVTNASYATSSSNDHDGRTIALSLAF